MSKISLQLFIFCLAACPLSKAEATSCDSAEYYCAWTSPKGEKPKETAHDKSSKFTVGCCYNKAYLQCEPCIDSWEQAIEDKCQNPINTKHYGQQYPNFGVAVHEGCFL